MVRLSIVIPFYNVEQYIAQCLDSVYQQDLPETEYEVICVNDASPDGSREIVKDYQKKHKNLVLVEHEVNKKLGAARNTGRRAAKGTYIWNVDSDDMIAPNCLKEMLDVCEKNDLNVLMFGSRFIRDGKIHDREYHPWKETSKVITGLQFWKEQGLVNQGHISQVWTQMYKKEYLDKKSIYSPEINMSEDVPYTYASILFADRMMVTNKPYYVYRENMASLTGTLRKAPRPLTIYENSFVAGMHMYRVMQQIGNVDAAVYRSVEEVTRYVVVMYHNFAKQMSTKDCKELQKLCLSNWLRNLFVYKVLSPKQGSVYTKFIFTGRL